MTQKEEIQQKIDLMVSDLKGKKFTIYFFILDTKGNPSGSLSYIYETAEKLISLGYNVEFLHNDKEFVGVGRWLGEKYTQIKHNYIESDNVKIKGCDFLVIPEIFSNVMHDTKKLPCKRIVLSQNFDYITEFIPAGVSWYDYGITDIITTTETQKKLISEIFPTMNIKVVPPSISNEFYGSIKPKKLEIGIIARETKDVNRVAKAFYWKYPTLKWVSFVDLKGYPKEVFSEKLRDTAIVVWVDNETSFGYSALEAAKSECLVIGKIPNTVPEWMYDENGVDFNTGGVWFDNMNDVHSLLAASINAFTNDSIPEEFFKESSKIYEKYTEENQKNVLEETFNKLIEERVEEFENVRKEIIKK